jgi:hypothetical protein
MGAGEFACVRALAAALVLSEGITAACRFYKTDIVYVSGLAGASSTSRK